MRLVHVNSPHGGHIVKHFLSNPGIFQSSISEKISIFIPIRTRDRGEYSGVLRSSSFKLLVVVAVVRHPAPRLMASWTRLTRSTRCFFLALVLLVLTLTTPWRPCSRPPIWKAWEKSLAAPLLFQVSTVLIDNVIMAPKKVIQGRSDTPIPLVTHKRHNLQAIIFGSTTETSFAPKTITHKPITHTLDCPPMVMGELTAC